MLRLAVALIVLTCAAGAAAEPPADALARLVFERPANEGRVGTMHFTLKNAAGATREREAMMIHAETGETTRIGIFFAAPAMIADTAFLSYDHAAGDDENWLFLPATERVRRLPASDRGDYFLGTDLTYGDIKDNFKFDPADWTFAHAGTATHGERELPVLEGTARSATIAKSLGYGAFRAVIDTDTRFPVQIDYTDDAGEPLKRVEVTRFQQVGGAWTAMAFSVRNLQTGHRTDVHFSDMRHEPALDRGVLHPDALADGVPRLD